MAHLGAGKFRRDVIANVISLGVAGVCGIALNFLIGTVYDPAALGIFNQVYAAYIVFAQLSVLGVNQSVVTHVAKHADKPAEVGAIVTAALGLAVGLATPVTVLFWLSAPLVARLLESADVTTGMAWAAPGLFLAACNKVSLAALNGTRRMGWYALLQGGRFVVMLGAFGACAALELERAAIPLILTASEAAMFLTVVPLLFGTALRARAAEVRGWIGRHISFGVRGFLTGVLMEVNTRVDVLMLGALASDRVVGLYSFAAVLAEGLSQLLTVLRTNTNPILTRALVRNDLDELHETIRRGKRLTYLLMAGVAVVAVAAYRGLVPILAPDADVLQTWAIFATLMAGIVLASGYQPFAQILFQGGRPGWQTCQVAATALVNVLANAALIPAFGAIGAAAATSIALVCSVLVLRGLARRLLRVRL